MSNIFFYTETAFHHEGDLSYLKELIAASKRSGSQGVKFQVLVEPDAFLSTRHSGFKTLSNYCFTASQWSEILAFTHAQQLETIFMPLDLKSLDLLKTHTTRYIDIHPVSFYDQPLLEAIKKTGIPVIIGVGGRSLEEIESARRFFQEQLQVLMVGFQAFPSDLRDIKLARIAKLKELYPVVSIGYADHSAFGHEHAIISNEYARLLGATVFEKHITLEEGKERVDYSAAVSESKIAEIIKRLTYLDDCVLPGDEKGLFEFSIPEVKYRERQKKVVLTADLAAGTVLTASHVTTRMIDQEGGFYKTAAVIGRKLVTMVEKDVMLEDKFLEG